MKSTDTNIEGSQYNIRLSINNIELNLKQIQSLSFREFVLDTAVELDLAFIDNGAFVEMAPITDGSILKLTISKDKDESPVDLEFDVLNTIVEKKMTGSDSLYLISLIGIQHSDYLFSDVKQRHLIGTSSEVINEIVSENKQLTYVEEVKSNDSQIWYQISVNDSSIIKNIINRAYYQEEDMPLIYCNKYNRFTYTTLKTKCAQKTKFQAINDDILVMDAGTQDKVLDRLIPKKDRDKTIYFRSDFKFHDNMPLENRSGGYGFDFTYFDGENFYDQFINFKFAPMTKYINKTAIKSSMYDSITYNMQNSNVHDNYLLAINQNNYLKQNMFSQFVTMTVSPNLKVDLMDKINVSFIKQKDVETGVAGIDDIHSGEYIVGGIYHNIHIGGMYTMILVLFRNGFNIKEDLRIQKINLQKVEK